MAALGDEMDAFVGRLCLDRHLRLYDVELSVVEFRRN